MKESYRKELANHPGPEPCEGDRKVALEALERVSVGWPLSSEINRYGMPMGWDYQKATWRRTLSRVRSGPAESKTPCMQRNFKRENRETPSAPAKQ